MHHVKRLNRSWSHQTLLIYINTEALASLNIFKDIFGPEMLLTEGFQPFFSLSPVNMPRKSFSDSFDFRN
jgi:hypothetical protein